MATLTNSTADLDGNTVVTEENNYTITGTWTFSTAPALAAGSVDAITEIASGLKSGADTTLVTGTAGTNGNLVQWNGDGDAVDASVAASKVVEDDGTHTISGTWTFSAAPIFQDSVAVAFGTGSDATISYDGTDMVISPAAVGSGDLVVSGGSVELDDSESLTLGTGKDATIQYDGTNLLVNPQAVGSGVTNFSAGLVCVNETSNADMTIGVTINQGANDDEALALKSSDVAHGITDHAETDTYGVLEKATGGSGGVALTGYSEDNSAVSLGGFYTDSNTTKTASGNAPVRVFVRKKSGTGGGNPGADDNIFIVAKTITPGSGAVFIIDEDGDFHYDGADGGAFDDHDDALLVRAFDLVTNAASAIRSRWDEHVSYNEDDLISLGILGAPVAEGGLVNGAQLQRLHNGAIWQLYSRCREQADRVRELEGRLKALEG